MTSPGSGTEVSAARSSTSTPRRPRAPREAHRLRGYADSGGDRQGAASGASRRLALPATVGLGAATVALGLWGYLETVPAFGFSDALYAAIKLLGVEYDGEPAPPWQLEVARYLGVLTLTVAVIGIVATVARDRVNRARTRSVARHHYVIVGLGRRGMAVASALRADRRRVVAIDLDGDSPRVTVARSLGVTLIVGDAEDARTFRAAAAARADHMFISLNDDSSNLQALEAYLAAVPSGGPTVHVAIDNQLLWRELHRLALTWNGEGGAIEFVSLPDRAAARLVHEAGGDLAAGRIIVWGRGPKAARVAVHAVRWVLLDGGEPELVLAGPHAGDLEMELKRTEPWIAATLSTELVVEPSDTEPAAAFVAGLTHADALAGASILAKELRRATIVAEVATANSSTALSRSGFPVGRVRMVDADAQVLGGALFDGSAREVIARARHAYYVHQDLKRGVTPDENPSQRPWDELPDSLRESNRAFADSVGNRLADLGAELEPLTGPPVPAAISDELIEELARVEKDRWNADLLAKGWRYHNAPKDPERKRHPLLVDWDSLPEEEREKDRDSIRALPAFLARLGYELKIPQHAQAPAISR